jgi:hypothetical protein
MVHFDHEEILDLCVGLILLVISLLLIGFFMARMARDEQDEYENVNILCGCCFKKSDDEPQQREFSSLNDLLLDVDKDETALVVNHKKERKGSLSTATEGKGSTGLAEADTHPRERDNDDDDDDVQSFSIRSMFPSILQDSDSSIKRKKDTSTPVIASSELEEPLLISSNQQNQ